MRVAEITRLQGLHYGTGKPVEIEISDDRISKITSIEHTDDLLFIGPGLIDNQVNGFAGVGFKDQDLTLEGIDHATRSLWKEGVTGYLPTIYTCEPGQMNKNLGLFAGAVKKKQIHQSIIGLHIEGPFLSPQDGYRGAHRKEWLQPPSWDKVQEWNTKANGIIRHLTLAPELPNSLECIIECVKQGIVIGLGHHNADTKTIRRAVDSGAAIATHLGNGCANTIHRHHNPLWPQLADDRLWASLIVDGFHLTPEQVQVFFKVKGPNRLILVSDIQRHAGLPPGNYKIDGVDVELSPEGKLHDPIQQVLFGAALPLSVNVAKMVTMSGCSWQDAFHMASKNVAKLYELMDRESFAPGQRADIIRFQRSGESLEVMETWLAGQCVYRK